MKRTACPAVIKAAHLYWVRGILYTWHPFTKENDPSVLTGLSSPTALRRLAEACDLAQPSGRRSAMRPRPRRPCPRARRPRPPLPIRPWKRGERRAGGRPPELRAGGSFRGSDPAPPAPASRPQRRPRHTRGFGLRSRPRPLQRRADLGALSSRPPTPEAAEDFWREGGCSCAEAPRARPAAPLPRSPGDVTSAGRGSPEAPLRGRSRRRHLRALTLTRSCLEVVTPKWIAPYKKSLRRSTGAQGVMPWRPPFPYDSWHQNCKRTVNKGKALKLQRRTRVTRPLSTGNHFKLGAHSSEVFTHFMLMIYFNYHVTKENTLSICWFPGQELYNISLALCPQQKWVSIQSNYKNIKIFIIKLVKICITYI